MTSPLDYVIGGFGALKGLADAMPEKASDSDRWLAEYLAGRMGPGEGGGPPQGPAQPGEGGPPPDYRMLDQGATSLGGLASFGERPSQMPGTQAPAQRSLGLGELQPPATQMSPSASRQETYRSPSPRPQAAPAGKPFPGVKTRKDFDNVVSAYSAQKTSSLSPDDRKYIEEMKERGRNTRAGNAEQGKNTRFFTDQEGRQFRHEDVMDWRWGSLQQKGIQFLQKLAQEERESAAGNASDERVALIRARGQEVAGLMRSIATLRSSISELAGDPEQAKAAEALQKRLDQKMDELDTVTRQVESSYGMDARPGEVPTITGSSEQDIPGARSQGGLPGATPMKTEVGVKEPAGPSEVEAQMATKKNKLSRTTSTTSTKGPSGAVGAIEVSERTGKVGEKEARVEEFLRNLRRGK